MPHLRSLLWAWLLVLTVVSAQRNWKFEPWGSIGVAGKDGVAESIPFPDGVGPTRELVTRLHREGQIEEELKDRVIAFIERNWLPIIDADLATVRNISDTEKAWRLVRQDLLQLTSTLAGADLQRVYAHGFEMDKQVCMQQHLGPENKVEQFPGVWDFRHRVFAKYLDAFDIGTFVETGIERGQTITAMNPYVRRMISIENDPEYLKQARKNFGHLSHVEIVEGDSRVMLGQVARKVTEPALFFLDAHNDDCPLVEELESLLTRPSNIDDVIIIDDARFLNGKGQCFNDRFVNHCDWPSLADLREIVCRHRPDYTYYQQDDRVYIHSKKFERF